MVRVSLSDRAVIRLPLPERRAYELVLRLDPIAPNSPEQVDVLSGLLHRHDVEERIGFEWPEGHYETLGGFLTATLGRFPVEGDVIPVGDIVYEVVSMDGHRVDQARVIRPRREEETS